MFSASSIVSRTATRSAAPFLAGPVLRVARGVHVGAEVRLDGTPCVLGNAREADVVLCDPGVAAEHVRLRFYGSAVAVDALGGDVAIAGRIPLRKGQGCRATLPLEIALGSALVQVAAPRRGGTRARKLSIGLAGLLAVLTVSATPFSAGIASGGQGAGAALVDTTLRTGSIGLAGRETEEEAPSFMRATSFRPKRTPAAGGEDPLDALRSKAAQGGLSALIFTRDGNHITVSGAINDAERPAFADIQRWFDGRYGDRLVLTSLAVPAVRTKPPRLEFQAVWFGADPYVVGRDGTRLYPGAALADGWVLKSISEARVLVARNGEEFALSL